MSDKVSWIEFDRCVTILRSTLKSRFASPCLIGSFVDSDLESLAIRISSERECTKEEGVEHAILLHVAATLPAMAQVGHDMLGCAEDCIARVHVWRQEIVGLALFELCRFASRGNPLTDASLVIGGHIATLELFEHIRLSEVRGLVGFLAEWMDETEQLTRNGEANGTDAEQFKLEYARWARLNKAPQAGATCQ